MDLKDYRVQMDDIDNQLIDLFRKRMETAGAIAAYKKEHGLPVLDAGREREKMRTLLERCPRRCATTPAFSTPPSLS